MINKRAGGQWQVKIRRKGWPPQSATFPTKKKAQDWAHRIESEMTAGHFVDRSAGQRTTLKALIELYLKEVTDKRPGEASRATERARLERFIRAETELCAHAVANLTPEQFEDYRDRRLSERHDVLAVRLFDPLEEALPALRRAVDLEPTLAAAYNELASVHRRLGRLKDARDWIEDGLSADPSFAPLHRNLARLALEEGRHEEALRALDDAARLDGGADEWDRQEIRFLYARARLGLGQVEAGCRELARLAALDPVSIGPWTEDGLLLAEQHDCDSKGDDHA